MKQRISQIFLGAFCFAAAGCSASVNNDQLNVDVVSDDTTGFSVNKMPLPAPSAYLRAATAQGLVTFDAQGRVVPALASRWMVTDDGLSYIFRLKKTRWNNMREVETQDVAAALNKRIRDMNGKTYGAVFSNVIKVERMTGRVLQIHLRAPMPNLLEYLASPEFGIIHENNGSGPMVARLQSGHQILSWRGEDAQGNLLLSDNRILLHKNKPADALARMKSEETDLITNGRFTSLPFLTAAQLDESNRDAGNRLGLFGLIAVGKGPFLSREENREVITMALDRPRMLTAFEDVTWRERLDIVPDTIPDRGKVAWPDWGKLNINDRKASAARIIAKWKEANGDVRPLRIAMPKGPGSKMLFAWIRADLLAIGLNAKKVAMKDSADLRLIDRLAGASSTAWYLDQISCRATPVCDAEADALVADGRRARSTAERKLLFGEAETAYQKKRNFIPIANPLRWTAFRPGLQGYASNPRGWHYLQTLGSGPT